MALKISAESYNGLPALYANAGKRVETQFKLKNNYHCGSGTSLTFSSLGTTLTKQYGNWMDFGFVVGDTITISFVSFLGIPNNGVQTFTRTVTYINDNIMYINTALPTIFDNKEFPTEGQFSGMFVSSTKLPQSVEFSFNLTKDGIESVNSVLDGELNRFIYNSANTMAVSDVVNMVQLGNKSGGIITNVTLTRTANTSDALYSYSNFTVDFDFVQWGLFESQELYGAGNYLAPFIYAKTLPLAGNPNGAMTDDNGAKQANVGWFNENYNGGNSPYVPQYIELFDVNGDSITQVDYSGSTNFEAVLTTPNQLNGTSKYRIGLAFLPETDDLFKNLPLSAQNNLLLNAPDVDFLHSATPDLTVYTGNTNDESVRFDLTKLKFSHSAGTLTVTAQILPINAEAFFDELTDGERKLIIWVQVSDHTKTGVLNDEVNVLIYNDDCFNAPTIGIQWPYVVSEQLLDHALNDITSIVTPNTTTEDDVLYKAEIQLKENVTYDGIRVSISARSNVSDEVFELESAFFNFLNVPYIGGKYQLNETINRGFNLPIGTDRNVITLDLNAANDTASEYGVTINYGFLNDWRYWVENANVDSDFFNMAEPNNGLNRNWQALQNGDWNLHVDFYVRKNGVEDFNHYKYLNRPYEDDPTVSCFSTITASDGTNPTCFKDNDLHKLDVKFTWNTPFTDEWVELTIEDFESGNRWVVSSLYPIGNLAGNPFKPLIGETNVKIQTPANLLIASVMVDTNEINVEKVSLSYRVYASPIEYIGYLITYRKDASLAYSIARKVSNDDVYNGALINVRRDSDDATLQIGHVNGQLNTATMLTFVGAANGFVVDIYDQSGEGNHANQSDISKQGKIIDAGVLVTSGGKPALKLVTGDYYEFTFGLTNNELIYQTWVFERTITGGVVALGSASGYTTGFVFDFGVDDVGSWINGAAAVNYGDTLVTRALLSLSSDGWDSKVYINNLLFATENDPYTVSHSFDRIFEFGGASGAGNFQELIYWKKDKTAEMTAINNNIIDFYGL
jgi:hypothetical protein